MSTEIMTKDLIISHTECSDKFLTELAHNAVTKLKNDIETDTANGSFFLRERYSLIPENIGTRFDHTAHSISRWKHSLSQFVHPFYLESFESNDTRKQVVFRYDECEPNTPRYNPDYLINEDTLRESYFESRVICRKLIEEKAKEIVDEFNAELVRQCGLGIVFLYGSIRIERDANSFPLSYPLNSKLLVEFNKIITRMLANTDLVIDFSCKIEGKKIVFYFNLEYLLE